MLHLVNFDRTEYDDIEPKSSEKPTVPVKRNIPKDIIPM